MDIIILDDEFNNFDLQFPEGEDNINNNNDINLPDQFTTQAPQKHPQSDDQPIELSTSPTPTPISHNNHRVRFSYHAHDGTHSAADLNPIEQSLQIHSTLDEIDHDNDITISRDNQMMTELDGTEMIMSAEDFFGLDDPNAQFKPVEGEDQLREYYHYLAQQLEQDHEEGRETADDNGIKYPSDEDAEWQEHDQLNLDHIVFQDEKVKIKTKPSTTPTVIVSTSSSQKSSSDKSVTATTTTTPTTTKAPLLMIPKDIAPFLALPITPGILLSPPPSTTTSIVSTQSALLQLDRIDPNKLAMLMDRGHEDGDDIAAQLQLEQSMTLPTRASRITTTTSTMTTGQSHLTLCNKDNGHDFEDDFMVSFDQGFLSPEELEEYNLKRKLLQRAHLENQRQRLKDRIISDPIQLQSQQDHFLGKMDQFDTKLDSLLKNSPMLLLQGGTIPSSSSSQPFTALEMTENRCLVETDSNNIISEQDSLDNNDQHDDQTVEFDSQNIP